MKGRRLLLLVALSILLASKSAIAQSPVANSCPKTEKGIVSSSQGVPGLKDHSDTANVSKGNHLLCKALSDRSSSAPSACFVTFSNGGSYTLGDRQDQISDYSGVMTLTCNGKAPMCCGVQIVPTKP
jgi:hypothetical protein